MQRNLQLLVEKKDKKTKAKLVKLSGIVEERIKNHVEHHNDARAIKDVTKLIHLFTTLTAE